MVVKANRLYQVKRSTLEKFNLDLDSLNEYKRDGNFFHVFTVSKGQGKKWICELENGERVELGGKSLKLVGEAEQTRAVDSE